MSELTRGPHQLRLLIDEEGHDWTKLTSNGVGNVVTVEPEIQPPNDRQIWFPVPVVGKKGYYTIIQDPASECPPGLARVEGSNKVFLSKQPGEWHLEHDPRHFLGSVYKVRPSPPEIGVDLLGKEPKGREVVIQPTPNISVPEWQFLIRN